MKRLARILGRSLVVVGLLLGVLGAIAWAVVRRNLPDVTQAQLSALSAPASAEFDARGIPTVRAKTILDAFRAQGYLVARDRMFQLEVQRRFGAGELAELFGEGVVRIDKLHRLYGFRQVAVAAAELLPSDERAALDAYADGVNAFIGEHRGRLGLELQVLGMTPRPWTASDSILVFLLMHESLSASWQDDLDAQALVALPEAERRFLMPEFTEEDVLVVPDALPRPPADAPAFFAMPHAQLAPGSPSHATDSDLPEWAGRRTPGIGSNGWVVGPSRSKSGKPLLANDPHLALRAPDTWYEVRFEIGARTIEGVSLPGIPGVVIGQTDRVAWGFTNLGTDVQDLFGEEPTGERVERISVKGGPQVEYRVPLGRHGPQVKPGYSLSWVALDPRSIRLPMTALMNMVDWKSFNDAFDAFTGPAQNVVYADADGHIGWRATGLTPIRRAGDDGLRVRDGNNPEDDWRGFVPMAELPRVIDPASGYIVTANQRVVGTSYPHLITRDWVPPNRARRIRDRIEEAGKLDRETMESIQLDDVSPFHRDLMRRLAMEVPSLSSFASWDGAANVDSTMYPVARIWVKSLRKALLASVLGDASEVAEFSWMNDESTLLAMVRADASAWRRAGLGEKAVVLHDAEKRAEEAMRAGHFSTWGEANRLDIEHPIGRAGGLFALLFNPPRVVQSGAGATVHATGASFGQSMRFVVDWGSPDETTLVTTLGESGHLGSEHRFDQFDLWRQGDPGGIHTKLKAPKVGDGVMFSAK